MRVLVLAGALALVLSSAVSATDLDHGKQLFQACAACHSDKPGNRLGPSLAGVVGRKAASLDDFRYSPAMVRSNLVWDDANLRDYIVDPQAKVKGNRMPYAGLKSPQDADDVVAYLKTLR